METMTQTTYIYDDEHNLALDLYRSGRENPPIFIYMHGGGLEAGDRGGPRALFDRLAADGIRSANTPPIIDKITIGANEQAVTTPNRVDEPVSLNK